MYTFYSRRTVKEGKLISKRLLTKTNRAPRWLEKVRQVVFIRPAIFSRDVLTCIIAVRGPRVNGMHHWGVWGGCSCQDLQDTHKEYLTQQAHGSGRKLLILRITWKSRMVSRGITDRMEVAGRGNMPQPFPHTLAGYMTQCITYICGQLMAFQKQVNGGYLKHSVHTCTRDLSVIST